MQEGLGIAMVEILVHASAPSRGQDDAQYRALVTSYLGFEPTTRIILEDIGLCESKQRDPPLSTSNEIIHAAQLAEKPVFKEVEENWDESYEESEVESKDSLPCLHERRVTRSHAKLKGLSLSKSFGSISENLDSPVIRRPAPRVPKAVESEADIEVEDDSAQSFLLKSMSNSCESIRSVVPDSQPAYNIAIPAYSSPTRILELYLQQIDDISEVTSSLDAHGKLSNPQGENVGLTEAPHFSFEHLKTSANLTTDQVNDPRSRHDQNHLQISSNLQPLISKSHSALNEIELESSSADIPSAASRFTHRSVSEPIYKSFAVYNDSDTHGETTKSSASPNKQDMELQSRQRPDPPEGEDNGQDNSSLCPPRKRPKLLSSISHSSSDPLHRRRRSPDNLQFSDDHKPPPMALAKPSLQRRRRRVTTTLFEIWPPKPPVSTVATVDDHLPPAFITAALAQLAVALSLPTRYRPHKQTRALRPMERGYWRVRCAQWDEGLRRRAWGFLRAYVEGGRAGWGVWATGEMGDEVEDGDEGADVDGEADEDAYNGDRNDADADLSPAAIIRVYCWGEVVGHVYLLLYLVSERSVKGSSAVWVDADGMSVVIMDP